MIVLGPGSLYTSIIPNLLIKEISEAIVKSPALKIYICNVMTQPGETGGYSAYDHIRALTEHSMGKITDYCLVNSREVPREMLERYRQNNSYPVAADIQKIRHAGYRVIEDDIINIQNYVRHDYGKLARIVMDLVQENY